MKAIHRYKEFKSSQFSDIILAIRRGKIVCGKYAHRGKAKESIDIRKKGVLFDDHR